MNATIRTYLLQHLAPALSQKFNINLGDVEVVINTFDDDATDQQAPPIPQSPERKQRTPAASPKKRGPSKDDLLKEARGLGLKVTTKMRKDEIQAVIDASKDAPPMIPAPTPKAVAKAVPPMIPAPTPKAVAKAVPPMIPAPTPKAAAKAEPPMIPAPTPSGEPRKVGSLEGKSFKSKNNTWTFGNLLGTGGFGAVYEVKGEPNLVIKTGRDGLKKNQDSGLFLEKAVYLKIRDKSGEIKGDKRGIPQMVDSGRLPKEVRANDYFIVMPKFETSLDDLHQTGTMTAQDKKKAINDIIEALNHLSDKGYLHLDIKAENIMRKNGRWYLIDYGMAERFDDNTETTPNPKKAGNGTARYMARDAHRGIMSRKNDLESLIYTLVEMEGHELSWHREKRKNEKDKDYLHDVLERKQEFFDTYEDLGLPQYYNTFIEYVDKLQPGTEPKYEALQ